MVENGINKCRETLGDFRTKLDEFFKQEVSYTASGLARSLGVPVSKARELLTRYARLELGEKILACVRANGECNFTAEL